MANKRPVEAVYYDALGAKPSNVVKRGRAVTVNNATIAALRTIINRPDICAVHVYSHGRKRVRLSRTIAGWFVHKL
jgi:hypothetical protein